MMLYMDKCFSIVDKTENICKIEHIDTLYKRNICKERNA